MPTYTAHGPNPNVAWLFIDTNGFLDESGTCDNCGVEREKFFLCLDGGDTLCTDCAAAEGVKA